MKKYVQPDPATGYRFTSYRLENTGGQWPLVEMGHIYHKIDLSDLAEPYLSAVKKSLADDATPKEINMVEVWGG